VSKSQIPGGRYTAPINGLELWYQVSGRGPSAFTPRRAGVRAVSSIPSRSPPWKRCSPWCTWTHGALGVRSAPP